jgi:hypothetical protein
MKSVKYIKHYMSKYKYPTRIISNGKEGTLVHGFRVAQKDLEIKLKRPLHKDTKLKTCAGNWCFMEPRNEV